MLFIGIDLGTSAVKLLLMDSVGNIHKIVSRAYPISFPQPGWSEQNPTDWLQETKTGILELTADCDKSQIAGIGCGGQMHGLVVLDENDQVIRPAILWNDGRTAEETAYLNEVIGREKLARYTANIAFAGFTAPKLLWMRSHEPENFKRIRRIMLPKDYINYMFSGVHCTDVSDASGTLLFDVAHKCWSQDMLNICGVAEEQMPEIFESSQAVGTLREKIAEELGLPKNVVIAAGAGDNAAAAVGTGTMGDGACNISLGTSGTIFISSDRFRSDANNALHAFAHADGHYHLMGCMLSAAGCNKWWTEDILQTGDYSAEQSAIAEEKLGNNHVYFLPYLMGERSPINDTNARGTFIGLTMDTTRADLTQAVLEGVTFAIRDSLEVARSLGLDIQRSRICGGGAKSPLWRKMVANICRLDIEVLASEEGPGYGGAMLAMVACGESNSVRTLSDQFVRVVETVRPDTELSERYEGRYLRFQKIYPALKNVFPALNG